MIGIILFDSSISPDVYSGPFELLISISGTKHFVKMIPGHIDERRNILAGRLIANTESLSLGNGEFLTGDAFEGSATIGYITIVGE